MSLKDLLAKQEKTKMMAKEEENKPKKNSFKLSFGNSSSAKVAEKDGEEETKVDDKGTDGSGASVPLSSQRSLSAEASSSPSLSDLNHESQPDKLQKETVIKFRTALDLLADNVEDKEIVGDCVRNVLGMLKEHEFLEKILKPEDCGMMIRGLREGYGVVIQKKQTKQRKKTASAAEVDKVLEDLADLDIGDL